MSQISARLAANLARQVPKTAQKVVICIYMYIYIYIGQYFINLIYLYQCFGLLKKAADAIESAAISLYLFPLGVQAWRLSGRPELQAVDEQRGERRFRLLRRDQLHFGGAHPGGCSKS